MLKYIRKESFLTMFNIRELESQSLVFLKFHDPEEPEKFWSIYYYGTLETTGYNLVGCLENLNDKEISLEGVSLSSCMRTNLSLDLGNNIVRVVPFVQLAHLFDKVRKFFSN